MHSLIIGMGEIGRGLYEVLKRHSTVIAKDKDNLSGLLEDELKDCIMHICLPYSKDFVEIVIDYINNIEPKYIVIHSTVPVGTTKEIGTRGDLPVFHSPVRATHPEIVESLKAHVKYISFDVAYFYEAQQVAEYFEKAGMKTKVVADTKKTELAKLLSLARNGTYIAFAKEQERICEHFGLEYQQVVTEFEQSTNAGLKALGRESAMQPILYPFQDYVAGHCTVENMKVLIDQLPVGIGAVLLHNAHYIDKGTVIWENCNIYPGTKIGKGCSIGFNCEIDEGVTIGNSVRIGAFCFIPSGVTIEEGCFIAPRVTFSNDKHPPSNRSKWAKTLIKKGAMVGVGSVILPGVTIGENAIVGAGSVVTKDVPDNEVWYGQAAYHHGKKEEVYQ